MKLSPDVRVVYLLYSTHKANQLFKLCFGADIGTSPLYVYASTFTSSPSQEDVVVRNLMDLALSAILLIVCRRIIFDELLMPALERLVAHSAAEHVDVSVNVPTIAAGLDEPHFLDHHACCLHQVSAFPLSFPCFNAVVLHKAVRGLVPGATLFPGLPCFGLLPLCCVWTAALALNLDMPIFCGMMRSPTVVCVLCGVLSDKLLHLR